jgi:hypothetical protein
MTPIDQVKPEFIASKIISTHRVHGFFPLSFDSRKRSWVEVAIARFGHRTCRVNVADESIDRFNKLVMALTGQELVDCLSLTNPDVTVPLSEALWQPMRGKGMALDDFYPHVRQIFGEKSEGKQLCRSYTLNSLALSHVNGGRRRQWRIPLRNAGQERAGVDHIYAQIEGARLFVFNTGVAILDLSWDYYGLEETKKAKKSEKSEKSEKVENAKTAEEVEKARKARPFANLLEGNYILSHANFTTKQPVAQADHTPPTMTAQVLHNVAAAVVPKVARPSRSRCIRVLRNVAAALVTRLSPPSRSCCVRLLHKVAPVLFPDLPNISLHHGRLIIYTQVLLAECATPEDMRQMGIWLSHRQTTDYGPTANAVGAALLEPFPYLCHVLAPEGAASVIFDKGMASDFAKNFLNSSAKNIYVPLYLDSLHTHFWLLEQTDWLPARAKNGDRQETESLDNLYARVVQFRRYFYFPMVSHIGLHNAFYQSSQSAFGIAERMRFLEQTSHDVAELLKVRRSKWLEPLAGGVAGFIVGHEFFDALSQFATPDMRVWLIQTAHASPAVLQSLMRQVEVWDFLTFFLSVIGALIGYGLVRYFGKRK